MKEERAASEFFKHFKLIFGLVLIALATGGMWTLYHQPVLYSAPNKIRDTPDVASYWNDTFHPELSVHPVTPWIPKAAVEESDLYITRTASEVSIRIDDSKSQGTEWRRIPPTLLEVPRESHSITLPTGETLTLSRISIYYRLGKEKKPFHQSFDPVSFEKIWEPPGISNRLFKDFPSLNTEFTSSNRELNVRKVSVFNAKTHFRLSGSAASKSALSQTSNLKQWHSSPILIVSDVQSGSEGTTIPFKKGEVLKTSAVTAKLTWIEPVAGSYTGGSSGAGKHSFEFSTNQGASVNSTIVGLSILKKNWVPSDFKLIAKIKSSRPLDPFAGPVNTQEKPATTFEVSAQLEMRGSFAISHFDCKADDIEELRLVHPEKEYRLVFKLDSIPGLPKENYDVENLFDVKIPYAEPVFIRSFLADTAQLKSGHLYPRKIVIDDMNLHEIVEQIRDDERVFKIKVKKGIISAVPSPKERLRDFWKEINKSP